MKVKRFKRYFSWLLTVIMLFSTMSSSVAMAAETELPQNYTVTVQDTAGGTVTLNNFQGKSINAVPGEEVVINAAPAEGYLTEKIVIKNADSGDELMAGTGENIYKFSMPAQNVLVETVFVNHGQPLAETESLESTQEIQKPETKAEETSETEESSETNEVKEESSEMQETVKESEKTEEAKETESAEETKETEENKSSETESTEETKESSEINGAEAEAFEAEETEDIKQDQKTESETETAAGNNQENTYEIQMNGIKGCTVTVNGDSMPLRAACGDTVTLKVSAATSLQVLAVLNDADELIALKDCGNQEYSFVMPESNVFISAIEGISVNTMAAGGDYIITTSEYRYPETNPNGTQIIGEYLELNHSITAFCTQHLVPAPAVGTNFKIIDTYTAENQKNETMRKILWYGWHGPGDLGTGYQTTHLAMSVANGYPDSAWKVGQKFIEKIAPLPAAPEGFNVYILSSGLSNVQQISFWEYNTTGKVNLKKVSANPSMTNGNSCYSLDGAEYGVYSDENCSAEVGTLITKANGESNTLELNAGQYCGF